VQRARYPIQSGPARRPRKGTTVASGLLIVFCSLYLAACVALPGTATPEATATPTQNVTVTLGPTVALPLDVPYLGIYSVFPDDLERVAAAGVSVVSVPPGTVEEMRMYLAAADALGLHVRLSLSPSFLDLDQERVGRYLDALAPDETIVMWYLPEEPKDAEDHARWKRLYELVKSRDPAGRPVGLYLARGATVEYFREWADTCDIFMMGAYPEYYDIPRAALYTRVHNASLVAAEHGMLTVAVPQFFDHESILATVGKDADEPRLHIGHPDAWEFRADAYTGWIAGASGLDWYSLKHAAPYPDLWDAMAAVVAELNELGPVLVEGTPGPDLALTILSGPGSVPSFGSMTEAPIQIRTYRYEGELYILAVSLADAPAEVQLEGLPSSADEVTVLFEDRNVQAEGGSMRDAFLPHAVHVYHLTR